MGDEGSFFGLKVPDGTDRRELYKSQYRGIWTYKVHALPSWRCPPSPHGGCLWEPQVHALLS